ncbi:MAG: hypothetical protein ACLGHN_06695 [Bacteriovoracia bacterium]
MKLRKKNQEITITMDVRYLILSLFFLVSCMPSATVSKGNLASTGTTGGTTSGGTNGETSSLTWNYLGSLSTNITINVSNLNTAYVVGTPVESYLSETTNFSGANYCLVGSYTVGGISYELRSRIVPISYYDFKQRRTVKNFRVDFQDVTNSSTFCNQTTRVQNSSGDYVTDTSAPPAALRFYNPALICPLCTTMLTASRVRIFKLQSLTNTLDEVPKTLINSNLLSMQVDPNNAASGGSSCTNSECTARGFDCCLDNQCVNDGATKPSASTLYPTLLQTAEQEKLQNPLAYLNYPQLYYICGTTVPPATTGGTSGGGSTGGVISYDPAFLQLKKDYYCIEHLKSQATVTPFHDEILTKTYTAAVDCLTAASDSSQTFYYQNVMKRLYETCGCSKTTLSDMVTSCPKYDYTVVLRDTNNEPTRIDCYTPPATTPTVPAQQSVTVPSRSAPHRFFDVNGVERSPSDGVEQEGDLFEYLDEGKLLPVQQPFSMNSVLGQMTVTLDKALPAKAVNVELDQVYFITTTSGYYTPCPSCAKDSWISSFTAFPSSSAGVGLQAVGHTTQRDAFSTNTSSGNYEDTIFGRACWLPPTMIPFSHSLKTTTQEQRLNRLKTQAALFVNGYQRDWFGFNKGALIGSFDGVTWFAIGKGRIVRSTSKKLFLAINAAFADVANPTMHAVNVHAYDGITQAAQVDYDPQYHQYHPYQNEAGNCQKYHMCSTDTDCVTKLGWEYACADVKDIKTNWPEFDADAKEKAATSQVLTLDQILFQKRFPSSSTKRCVYRGAGAVCHTNAGSLPATDLNKKKILTCAPNFFCASTGSSSHNNKIARYAAALEELPVSRNHFFGKDANILGRPHDYIASGTLTSEIRNTLKDSLIQYESTMSAYTGLCQPGKNLPTTANQTTLWNPFTQHQGGDPSKRTDFISQIGGCNSTLFSVNRHSSCPVIGTDGNFEIFANGTISAGYPQRASNQNACGLESLLSTASLSSTADTLQSYSPFRMIEAKPLNSQIILDPTLVRDACLRRAGAVCHTDLDCTPNKKHGEQVDFFGTNYFGNAAEKSYWSEYLVCGQTDPKPFPSDSDEFKNYDMSKNRCCREVGNDITTYTADIPTATQEGSYDTNTVGLKMSVAPGIAPNDPKRYSRLATVEELGTISTKPVLSAYQERDGSGYIQTNPAFTLGTNLMSSHQWKTLGEANSESCCGGGWIRKFSDGTTDWTRRDRVVLDVTNFRCINSRNPILTNPSDILVTPTVGEQYGSLSEILTLLGQDYGDYCKDGTNTNGACAQYSVADSKYDITPQNDLIDTTVVINTIKPDFNPLTNPDFYFKPRSGDSNSEVIVDYNNNNSGARRHIAVKLPSYASREFDDAYDDPLLLDGDPMPAPFNIRMVLDNGITGHSCTKLSTFNPTDPTDSVGATGSASCHFVYDRATRVLKVGASNEAASSTFNNKKVGVEFTVRPAGYNAVVRSKPGSSGWYLRRLGRLELSGIPQIAHEALTCNDNRARIVPGIFKTGINTVTDFSATNFSFLFDYLVNNPANPSGPKMNYSGTFTNRYGLQIEPVFSENDFKCCTPLGKTVSDANKCCSGFAVEDGGASTVKTCALPPGTNLTVYFNRFVSNEGRGTDQPGGGLLDADFDERTGEPLIETSVNDKIKALGRAYCSSGDVRQGGAFGSYEPEPQGLDTDLTSRIYNIVDSSNDIGEFSNAGQTVSVGYNAFSEGFRWNHHLYCADE